MKKVINLTNKYIIVATPLLLFLFFLSIYFVGIMRSGNQLKFLVGMLLVFIMIIVFISGWGNMLKSAALDKEPDEPYLIIKDFTPGVGEYFLPIAGFMTIILIINILTFILTYNAGMHFIGDIGITSEALSKAMANNEALKAFLLSLSSEQILKLNLWNILVLSVLSITYFVMMFYLPAIFFDSKNPFKALLISIKNIFSKKIFSVIGLYIIIFFINFIISILSAICANNALLSFAMTLVNFYFICAVAIGIFWYYSKNFCNSHLGNEIDTYI